MENLETDLRSVPLEKILYALSDETRLKIISIIDEAGVEAATDYLARLPAKSARPGGAGE